jgi:hypothetical protein
LSLDHLPTSCACWCPLQFPMATTTTRSGTSPAAATTTTVTPTTTAMVTTATGAADCCEWPSRTPCQQTVQVAWTAHSLAHHAALAGTVHCQRLHMCCVAGW